MQKIGLDIGFGDVKVVTQDVRLKFATAISFEREGVIELGERQGIEFEGQQYLVGEKALREEPFGTRSIDFLIRYAPLLTYEALRRLDLIESGEITVAVGLPVSYFTPENREKLSQRLSGFFVDQKTITLNVFVYPQGVGVYNDYRYSPDFTETTSAFVLDLGFNTVDMVSIRDGAPYRGDSGMLDHAGISRILDEVRDKVQKRFNIDLGLHQVKEIFLANKINVFGREEDLSTTIREIQYRYIQKLMALLEDRYGQRFAHYALLILAGGGAYYLRDNMPPKYRHLIYTPENPEYSNARGFLKMLG